MIIYDETRTNILSPDTLDYETGRIQVTNEFADEDMWNEEKRIAIYIPYTKQELIYRKIGELIDNLNQTDYQAIKFAEGELSEEEYAPIRLKRAEWRKEINELQMELLINPDSALN